MVRILSVAVAVLFVLASFSPVVACDFGVKSADVYKTIGLTEEQIAKLEPLRQTVKKARAEAETKSEELRKQIDKELLKKEPDKKAVAELTKKQGEARAKVSETRADALLKVKAIVDEKQFAKLVELHWACRCTDDTTAKESKE